MNSIKKKKSREEQLKQRAMTAWAIQKEVGGDKRLHILCIRWIYTCDLKVHCRSEEKDLLSLLIFYAWKSKLFFFMTNKWRWFSYLIFIFGGPRHLSSFQLCFWGGMRYVEYSPNLHSPDAFVQSGYSNSYIHWWQWLPTRTSGFRTCPRTLQHADQGNHTSDLLNRRSWLYPWATTTLHSAPLMFPTKHRDQTRTGLQFMCKKKKTW